MRIMNPEESRKMIDIEDLPVLLKRLHEGEITDDEFKSALKYLKHLIKEHQKLLKQLKRRSA